MNTFRMRAWLSIALALAACRASAQTSSQAVGLGGSAWQLVRFQGGDDTTLTPDDKSKYTIEFGHDGGLSARIDCNRGRGAWTSSGPSLQLGPLALTRALCPPGSLHDRIVKDWAFVRSYVVRDGHLFLSLMADGGIYEFEPIAGAAPRPTSPIPSTGPVTYRCVPTGGGSGAERMTATFYQTTPPMVLIERGNQTRPAFNVVAASGARYEGPDIVFWEARGAVSLTWSGATWTCTPN